MRRMHWVYCLAALGLVSGVMIWRGAVGEGRFTLSGPYTQANLSVFVVHGADRTSSETLQTLAEALAAGAIEAYESEEIDEVEMENCSDKPVFIQGGEIVKGGKQDRMLAYDCVVQPQSGRRSLEAFCIESDRWSKRGEESDTTFEKAPAIVPHHDIKAAAMEQNGQIKVWQEVETMVDNCLESGPPSWPATTFDDLSRVTDLYENERLQGEMQAYIDALITQLGAPEDAVGLVTVVNGEIIGADIYRSAALYSKMQAKLLEAAALEAIAEYDKDATYAAITSDDVYRWLSEVDAGETSVVTIDGRMHLTKKISGNAVSIECADDTLSGVWIHRNIISK